MKKTLAALLALVMLFAVCVPAFAANPITNLTEQTGETVVKTSTQTAGGVDARSFTVWIPAETPIPWGSASVDLTYDVEAHLTYGEALNVSVTGSGAMTLKEDAAVTLPYSLSGNTTYNSGDPVVYPAETKTIVLGIAESAWNHAIVGEYSDTLTFTAEAKK